jgi:hypothetical protein
MGAPLGFKTFATGDVLTAADTNGYLMQGVWTFADAAARTAAVTSPQEGNMSYLKSDDTLYYYSGSAWTSVVASAPSGMTLLSTTSLTGASVSLSSISSAYKMLRLFIELPLNASDTWDTKMCFNGDTTANRHQNLSLSTDTTGVTGSFSQTSGSITYDGLDNTVVQTLVDITIPDYANSNTWKMAYVTSVGNNSTTTTNYNFKSNVIAYNQTTAISSLLFKPGSGNFTSGTIYCYGVK